MHRRQERQLEAGERFTKKGEGSRSQGPELTHFTEKLVLSLESAEGDALVAPEPVTMVIWWTFAKEPMAPVTPLTVAKQVEAMPVLSVPKYTVPKLASGRTPPLDEGASAIHSADERWAEFTLADLLADAPVVVSVMFTVKDLPLNWASANILSPG